MATAAAERGTPVVGLGGSQLATALGLSPWSAPIQAWQQLVEGFEQPDNPAMKWGRLLEGPIRQHYADEMGVRVHVPAEPIYRDGWKRARVDGLVVDEGDRPQTVLEIKTAGAHLEGEWGESGSDQVPISYAIQCAWYLHVTDLPRCDLAALIGGRDYRLYRLERDLEFEADLVAGAEEFWQKYVLPGVPPPVDASPAYRDYLVRRWRKTQGVFRVATANEEGLIHAVMEHRTDAKSAERALALLENRLREAIADADGLELASGGRVTCKPQVRRTVDWEAVARELALRERLSEDFIQQLAKEHTKTSEPFRPLRWPSTRDR